jgi:hypothetical protein
MAHCEALLALLSAPEVSLQLRLKVLSGNTFRAPLLTMLVRLLPTPPGGWGEPALRAVAALLDATLAYVPPLGDPAWQESVSATLGESSRDAVMLEAYCTELAPVLLDLARASQQAPPLAAALARCGFGELAVRLTFACDGQCAPDQPWVSSG